MDVKADSHSDDRVNDQAAMTKVHLSRILKVYVIPAFAGVILAFAIAYASIFYTLTRGKHDVCLAAVITRDDYRRLLNGIIDVAPFVPESALAHQQVEALAPREYTSDCPGYFLDWLL